MYNNIKLIRNNCAIISKLLKSLCKYCDQFNIKNYSAKFITVLTLRKIMLNLNKKNATFDNLIEMD